MQGITNFLWFDTQAEEAARFYTSVFPNSSMGRISRYGEHGPKPAGTVMVAEFTIGDTKFSALNGGPEYRFNPSISFVIACENQQEVDYFWQKLLDGGKAVACGWLEDKYGISWQVTPIALINMINDPDREKADRVMAAMMQMVKLDIPTLEAAYRG